MSKIIEALLHAFFFNVFYIASFFSRHFVVCYYTGNKVSSGSIQLEPNKIDPNICTHIIVGFATVVNCTIDLGDNLKTYQQVVGLKKNQPNLKVMVSVGGADNDSGFPEMVLNHTNRKT